MTVTVTANAVEELAKSIEELEVLTGKPTMTRRDESRHAFLLAKISLLKQGIPVQEIRAFETDRLLAAAGLNRAPQKARTKLSPEIEDEWRAFVGNNEVRMTSRPPEREIRANEAGTQSIVTTQGATGGYFVPQGIHDRAFETMRQYDQIFDPQFSNIVETDNGGNTSFPAWDDVSISSVQISETSQSSEVDIASFGQIQLNAFAFRSRIVAVSIELLQDSAFPWGQVLERIFAMRHARGVGAALINGGGVGSPTGLLTATVSSGASPIIAAGAASNDGGSETGATSIGTRDLASLYAKLDPAYRPGAAWYMADGTLTSLLSLIDKEGRPIVKFRQGLTDEFGDCPYILGKPVAICPSMPAMASGKNSVLFGNPFYFVVRTVPSSMFIRRFWETPLLVQYGLIGFESWMRVDSNLVAPNASYLPYQFIQQHS